MTEKKLSLVGVAGTIDLQSVLDGVTGSQVVAGLSGSGLPPVDVQWADGAGSGSTYRGARMLPRDVDLPIVIDGASEAEVDAQLSLLARTFDPDAATLPYLVFGDWRVQVARVGGGDVIHDRGNRGRGSRHWVRTVIQLRAGQPAWETVTASTATIGGSGHLTVTNTGDARAWPVWRVTGPASGVSVKRDGVGVNWVGTVDAANLVIMPERARVTDDADRNRYAGVQSGPVFQALNPGSNVFTVVLSGADETTEVTCSWRSRRWAVS